MTCMKEMCRLLTSGMLRVATVAVHLDMVDDAIKLFITCERYDLLNRLYQACGQWDRALEVAEKYDRIHLRATHYAHAKQLEILQDYKGAVKVSLPSSQEAVNTTGKQTGACKGRASGSAASSLLTPPRIGSRNCVCELIRAVAAGVRAEQHTPVRGPAHAVRNEPHRRIA